MNKYLFFALILIVVCIRFVGINHGSPLVYNIDEPALVRSSYSLFFNTWIDHFDWPHFYYYINFVVYFVFSKVRSIFENVLPYTKDLFPIFWDQRIIFYLISRFVNISVSLLTGVVVYFLIKKLINKKYAEIATIGFLLLPGLNFQSHYALPDTPLMLFGLLGTFVLYIAYTQRYRNKYFLYYVSAFVLGLATGVKYNGLLFFVLVPILLFIRSYKNIVTKDTAKHLVKFTFAVIFLTLTFLLGFVITTPALIPLWDRFWSYQGGVGVLWQYSDNLSTVTFREYPYHLYTRILTFIENTNLFVISIYLVTPFVLYIERFAKLIKSKRSTFIFVIWCFSLFYFLNASRYELAGFRFFVPIVPLIYITATYTLFKLSYYFKINKKIFVACLVIFFLSAGYQTISHSLRFSRMTTLNIAYAQMTLKYNPDKVYIKGEDLDKINGLNNLKLSKLRESVNLLPDDIIFITRDDADFMSNLSVKYTLIDIINCENKCIGPVIDIYLVN